MKTLRYSITLILFTLGFVHFTGAAVILDDTWADGNRTNTSLPTESAWYSSVGSALKATTNAMIGTMAATQPRSWWTYFTTNVASPVQLAVGEALKTTLVFYPTNVVSSNNSAGFRIGLYNSSTGARTTADNVFPGATNINGYMLNVNFGTNFGNLSVNKAFQLMVHTNLDTGELNKTLGDYKTLLYGGPDRGDVGFTSELQYTLVFLVARTNASSVEISAVATGGSLGDTTIKVGESLTNLHQFDTFVLYPARGDQTCDAFRFTEFKVEVVSASGASFLITSIVPSTVTDRVVTWQSETGKTYVVESRNDLATGSWATNYTVTAAGTSTSYTNTTSVSKRFYRVGLTP